MALLALDHNGANNRVSFHIVQRNINARLASVSAPNLVMPASNETRPNEDRDDPARVPKPFSGGLADRDGGGGLSDRCGNLDCGLAGAGCAGLPSDWPTASSGPG
jgi:hypothetical protein